LRNGGLLLPLDVIDGEYPEELFERIEGGFLRARSGLARRHRSPPPPAPASARPGSSEIDAATAIQRAQPGSLAADVSPFVRTIGLPLLLCDARLRVLCISDDARAAFGLFDGDAETDLATLSAKLPGGGELLMAARRALAARQPEQLLIRGAAQVFLARVSLARDADEPCLSITLIDVKPLDAAKSEAVVQRQQHAALARLSELALTLAEPKHVYDEALALIFENIPFCSAGVLVELTGRTRAFDVIASRGLGVDPLRTLRRAGGSWALLDAVVARGCMVSQSGELATWAPSEERAGLENRPPLSRTLRAGSVTASRARFPPRVWCSVWSRFMGYGAASGTWPIEISSRPWRTFWASPSFASARAAGSRWSCR
jgi:hypothetical protein